MTRLKRQKNNFINSDAVDIIRTAYYRLPLSTTALQAYYVTVVEDKPIGLLYAEYRLPLLDKSNSPCNAVSLR